MKKLGLNQTPYEYIKKHEDKYIYVHKNFDEEILELNEICEKIANNLKYPMFVKPSNSGSSVGVKKANNKEEIKLKIEN